MIELFASWVEKYPMIVSIEDPLDQDDWTGYAALDEIPGTQDPDRGRRLLRHQHRATRQGHQSGAAPTAS